MSQVRVLVGTKKGAFILTADGKRERWEVTGPHFAGWEIYHLKGSPVDPNRLYASQTSGWFGQIIQRSDDGGKTWQPPGSKPEDLVGPGGMPKGESNMFVYEGAVGTHKWYDGTQHPWEFKRIWHLEPSLADPDTVFAGAEDAAIFKTTDGGKTWKEFPGLRQAKGHLWQPGAGGMAVHTILLDPKNANRIYVAISAAGAFRTDDSGKTWKPINRGLKSQYELPDPDAEVGHCVHRIALHPSHPDVLFMQKHWDIMRTNNAGESWSEVSGNLPTDFGFPIDVHAHEPETIYVVPIKSDSEHFPPDGKLRVYRSRTGGNEWEPLTKGLPQQDCYVNVLRDAMAVDSLDSCGVYFGTTGGQVYVSADNGDNWEAIVRDLPAVLSVEVQTLPMIRVELPFHLRTLARVDGEVQLDVPSPVTLRSALDALEARYPVLRGTVRDHLTLKRRPFVRFFACKEDLSLEPPETTLPDPVVSGAEPFLIIGAMAGG